MARPKKQQEPERKPRTLEEIFKVLEASEALYMQTGGNDIDTAIRALNHTMSAYDSQMEQVHANAEVGVEFDAQRKVAWGPTITEHEARLTASRISILVKQREEKLAQCRAWIEEGFAAKEAASEAAGKLATGPAGAVPEVGISPDGPADTAGSKPATVPTSGDSPLADSPVSAASTGEFQLANRRARRLARRQARKQARQ